MRRRIWLVPRCTSFFFHFVGVVILIRHESKVYTELKWIKTEEKWEQLRTLSVVDCCTAHSLCLTENQSAKWNLSYLLSFVKIKMPFPPWCTQGRILMLKSYLPSLKTSYYSRYTLLSSFTCNFSYFTILDITTLWFLRLSVY